MIKNSLNDEDDLIDQTMSERSAFESNKDRRLSISSYYELLCDKNRINTLANDGDQPFMETLSKHFKVLDINHELNFFQYEYIVNFIHQ